MDEVTAARAIALAQIQLALADELAKRLGVPPADIHPAFDGRNLDLNRLSDRALEALESGTVDLSDLFEPGGVDLRELSAEQMARLERGETLPAVLGLPPGANR